MSFNLLWLLAACQSPSGQKASVMEAPRAEADAKDIFHGSSREGKVLSTASSFLGNLHPGVGGLYFEKDSEVWFLNAKDGQSAAVKKIPTSVDGSLAWTTARGGKELTLFQRDKEAVYLVTLGEKGELSRIRFKDQRRRWDPSVSPDGKWVLYAAQQGEDPDQVFIEGLNRDLQRTFPVVRLPGKSASVSFHPTQKKILWRSFHPVRKDLSDVYVADYEIENQQLVTKNVKKLTENFKGLHLTPVWVGHQSRVLFASNAQSHDRLQLFFLDLDDFCVQKFRSSADNEWMPLVSEEEKWVYWISKSGNSATLKVAPYSRPTGSCEKSNLARSGGGASR